MRWKELFEDVMSNERREVGPEKPYVIDWERIVRDAVAMLVQQGWSADEAHKSVWQSLNSAPPIPWPEG